MNIFQFILVLYAFMSDSVGRIYFAHTILDLLVACYIGGWFTLKIFFYTYFLLAAFKSIAEGSEKKKKIQYQGGGLHHL